jgi:hypothetical protein
MYMKCEHGRLFNRGHKKVAACSISRMTRLSLEDCLYKWNTKKRVGARGRATIVPVSPYVIHIGSLLVGLWSSADMMAILTCICLRRRLFRVTLEISRTAPWYRDATAGTLTATDTCIGYHVTRFEASRNVNIGTRYVYTCVGAGSGMSGERRKTHVLLLCVSVIFFNVWHV